MSRPTQGAAFVPAPAGAADRYEEWVTRVGMTYESVAHCCRYRLAGEPGGPERVGLDVVAGLLARPRVFRFFGLPFSGRVGHLAEVSIAEIRAGRRNTSCPLPWTSAAQRLRDLPADVKEVVLACYVDDLGEVNLVDTLGADAGARRDGGLAALRELAGELRGPDGQEGHGATGLG